jgi:mono/diheme cytochrome c family protein
VFRPPSRYWLAATAAVALAVGVGWALGKYRTRRPGLPGQQPSQPAVPPANRGEQLFVTHCASCHGAEGRGDGPGAAAGSRPHDFAARPWKSAPTEEAIRKAILGGVPGTPMPSFRLALPPADVGPLVGHVLQLARARPAPGDDEGRLLRELGFVDLRGGETPGLTVVDARGTKVRLGGLKGRVVLLHFWGTSCPHCLKELSPLQDLERALAARGLSVLHVCADADELEEAQAQAGRAAPGVQVFAPVNSTALARFDVRALPTVWLVGPDGKPIGRSQGARDWSDRSVRRLIERWLPPGGTRSSEP